MDDILTPQYIIADGPQGLMQALDNMLVAIERDPPRAPAVQYILYQLGNQKSFIKVDMSSRPFQFWYRDLLGRPATYAVKETIARFLTDRCDEENLFLPSDETEN